MKGQKAMDLLETGILEALKTYSNTHRGSGQNSLVTTHLLEEARGIFLDYLDLDPEIHSLVFCSPRGAELFRAALPNKSYQILSSKDFGLSLGVRVLAADKKALPKSIPFLSGGGTTKLVAEDWIIWADAPYRFEAGTPAIINVIAFARALGIVKKYGMTFFLEPQVESPSLEEIMHIDGLQNYSGRELLEKLRETLIGKDLRVPTCWGPQAFINLDNSASTPSFLPIWDSYRRCLRVSPSIQGEVIQEARSICAEALGAPLDLYDLIFTSNTTEAINLAAESLSIPASKNQDTFLLSSFLEHSSNDLPWRNVPGIQILRLRINEEGFLNREELERHLRDFQSRAQAGEPGICLVSLTGASNVLGTCNDLTAISELVHRYGSYLLVDAAQLIAHRPLNMESLGIDFLAFSGHKVYAPFGAGALIARKGLLNFSQKEKENLQERGEENVSGIAALGKALQLMQRIGMELIQEEEHQLMVKALKGMRKIKGLKIYGLSDPDSPRLRNKVGVIPFEIKGRMPSQIGKLLAENGAIGIRYGCHCAHLTIKKVLKISPFLEKVQRLIQTLIPKMQFLGVDRMSLGIANTEAELDHFLQVLDYLAEGKKKKGTRPTWAQEDFLSHAQTEQLLKNYLQVCTETVYGLKNIQEEKQ